MQYKKGNISEHCLKDLGFRLLASSISVTDCKELLVRCVNRMKWGTHVSSTDDRKEKNAR